MTPVTLFPVSSTNLVQYYADRAPEYEKIYHKPERQCDLAHLRELVGRTFTGQKVLEIACGTGYWTKILAECSASVIATDINEEVLEIARGKRSIASSSRVEFRKMDAYTLTGVGPCSASLSAFWWSHIPKARIRSFLEVLHSKLQPGSTVLFIDNRFASGSSTPIFRTDEEGNTYQLRTLKNASVHEVLKNFPTETELRSAVAPFVESAMVDLLEYYWVLRYELPSV